jgi:hypothetical protein
VTYDAPPADRVRRAVSVVMASLEINAWEARRRNAMYRRHEQTVQELALLCELENARGTRAVCHFPRFLPFRFASRTPGPPPFSEMNATPAFSKAARIFPSV